MFQTASFPVLGKIARFNVFFIAAEASIGTASRLMAERNFSRLIFKVDGQPRIFSIEHLLRFTQEGISSDSPLRDLSIRNALTVKYSDRVFDALTVLERNNEHYLCVLGEKDDDLGILTYSDLLSAIDPSLFGDRTMIGDILSRREAITYTPDWILEDVLVHLTDVESSIIVMESGLPVGIVTAHDAFKAIAEGIPVNRQLAYYMSQPVISLDSASSVADALLQLKEGKIKRAVVAGRDGHILGVVTQRELVRFTYGYWLALLNSHTKELNELIDILNSRASGFHSESQTDSLTSIGNRRLFKKRLAEEMGRSQRYDPAPFSILLVDIDHFKRFNEIYGHQIGDDLLKSITQIILDNIRDVDFVFRWGGDEFAILAPHTGNASAKLLADRINAQIERKMHVGIGGITASIGVATYSNQESEKSFFERLDTALSLAKTQGGNRVHVAS